MLNFNVPEKGLGLVSPSHFVYDFSRKMLFMLYSISWPNFIVWLCITVVYLLGCDVIKFEINLSVLINQFVPPTFCLCFAFTGINFRGMLHHICDVASDENMRGPIRNRKWRNTNWLINYIPYLSDQVVLLHDQKVKTKKFKYLENEKSFWGEKAFFIIFKGL